MCWVMNQYLYEKFWDSFCLVAKVLQHDFRKTFSWRNIWSFEHQSNLPNLNQAEQSKIYEYAQFHAWYEIDGNN